MSKIRIIYLLIVIVLRDLDPRSKIALVHDKQHYYSGLIK